jgi:hypothetical protein
MSRALSFVLVAACACATAQQVSGQPHRIFVGHSNDGEVLVSASHADAMRGLVMPASRLEVKKDSDPDGDGDILCKRDVLTGTHVPQWICRYVREIEEDRLRTRILIDRLPKGVSLPHG